MHSLQENDWVPAKVPGSVYQAYLDAGKMDDPFYRDNEEKALNLMKQDFEFATTFDAEEALREADRTVLHFDGIDTLGEIYLNGTHLGDTENMHREWEFDVKELLKAEGNELRVILRSPVNYIYDSYEKDPLSVDCSDAMKGCSRLRKAHCMFGWDWGPRLPDAGIFREVKLLGITKARFDNVRISQKHVDGQVDLALFVGTETVTESPEPFAYRVTLTTPEGKSEVYGNSPASIHVEKPELWWPNGYGKQNLYGVKIELLDGEKVLDVWEKRIGLRTMTVAREKDQWGECFCHEVNGVRIFAMGADYIPEDNVLPRVTPERTRQLLTDARDCHFNCIRVWGGGYYPDDFFYDICDELGLIVWQDFMYACNVYELTDALRESIIEETKDNVKRLRHHAGLGLWCGNNEMESAWDHWGGFNDHSDALKQDYLTMFEKLIPEALKSEDDATFYWPSSPSSGGNFTDPDSDDIGDRHYWDVWHGEKPFSDYENYYFRFCSEFGFQSFPCKKTINTFTLPEDRNIFSEVMESHQKNGSANAKILHYIAENFLYPKDFESLIYISQVLQAIAIKSGVEHWRRNRGRCMGAIYWQLNDNWPVASWASIDYFGRWKALQYFSRHFYADVLGSLKVSEDAVYTPYLQNETMQEVSSDVTVFVKNMLGEVLWKNSQRAVCEPLSVKAMGPVSLKDVIEGRESEVFVEAVFTHSDGTLSRQVEMPKPYKHMQIKKAEITFDVMIEGNLLTVRLKSDAPAFFVSVESNVDLVWSDNFMHLTGKEPYEITAVLPEGAEGVPKIRVRSLCDSWVTDYSQA